jgi:hypothetical protein
MFSRKTESIERLQILALRTLSIGVGHGGEKIVARDCLPVVALEIKVHSLAEAGLQTRRENETGEYQVGQNELDAEWKPQTPRKIEQTLPSTASYRRITSAPFSYTVSV